jgi:hypothetical protein
MAKDGIPWELHEIGGLSLLACALGYFGRFGHSEAR